MYLSANGLVFINVIIIINLPQFNSMARGYILKNEILETVRAFSMKGTLNILGKVVIFKMHTL